jgi:hypothetical protein
MVLEEVCPKEWISRTKLALAPRSKTLQLVDEAYAAYHRTRAAADKKYLHDKLHTYLLESGRHWANVKRNTESGGLLKEVYDLTDNRPVPPPTQAASALAAEVAKARHRVLLLWKDAEVITQWAKICLQGALTGCSKTLNLLGQKGVVPLDFKIAKIGSLPITVKQPVAAGKLGLSIGNAVVTGWQKASTVNTREVGPSKWQKVKNAVKGFGQDLYHELHNVLHKILRRDVFWLADKIAGNEGTLVGIMRAAAEKLVLFFTGHVCKAAVPFVGAGIDVVSGVCEALRGIKERMTTHFERVKFVVAPGHPELIANAIERHMNLAIGKGLFTAIQGGAKIGLQFLTGAASSIVDLVAAFIELAVRVFKRIREGARMSKWIDEVKEVCKNVEHRDGVARPAIVTKDSEFTELFKRGCKASVCIPMMTLNSGVAGDQMMFMKMFDDTGRCVTQGSFNAATAFFSRLKEVGKQYLRSTGFQFTSTCDQAAAWMKFAVSDGPAMPFELEGPNWSRLHGKSGGPAPERLNQQALKDALAWGTPEK